MEYSELIKSIILNFNTEYDKEEEEDTPKLDIKINNELSTQYNNIILKNNDEKSFIKYKENKEKEIYDNCNKKINFLQTNEPNKFIIDVNFIDDFEFYLKIMEYRKLEIIKKLTIFKKLIVYYEYLCINILNMNYKKDIIIARLITYIVECKERNNEIVRWIEKLALDPNRKILVLSARIAHLEILDKKINSNISRSYYIGGMKEEIRESGAQTSRVLLASYSMASEAMNIKTLNTVILASPRTNVEQSTGRILRTRISERVVQPLILDIVDPHDPLLNQWRHRESYYKKCKYNIETIVQGKDEGNICEPLVSDENGCLFIED